MLMSMFSSFDAFNAESLGHRVSFSWPAGLKKEANLPGSSSSSTSPQVSEKKAGARGAGDKGEEGTSSLPTKKPDDRQHPQRRPRFAVELDGVHCFETIIPY